MTSLLDCFKMLKMQSLIIQIINKDTNQGRIYVKAQKNGDLYIIQRTAKVLKRANKISHKHKVVTSSFVLLKCEVKIKGKPMTFVMYMKICTLIT